MQPRPSPATAAVALRQQTHFCVCMKIRTLVEDIYHHYCEYLQRLDQCLKLPNKYSDQLQRDEHLGSWQKR